MYEPKLEFPEEWSGGSNPKKPSVRGVWIFSGATWISYLVFLTLTIFKNEEKRKSIAEKSLRKKRRKLEQ